MGRREKTNQINKINKKQERREKTPLAMMPVIHLDRHGQVGAVGATPTSGRGALSTPKRGTTQIAADMTMKRQRISELYESKEKNASGMVSMTKLSKLLILIEKMTRRTSEATATTERSDISTLVKRLKKSADRLEEINRERKHAQGADTWAKIARGLAVISQKMRREVIEQTSSERKSSREMKIMT